jgi:hypothetical protein
VNWILRSAAVAWAVVFIFQIGTWSSAHAVPLQGVGISLSLPPAPEWRAVHVLVDGCACSRNVADYLRRRGPVPGWVEEIWVLGGPQPDAIPGFTLHHPDEAAIQTAGIVGGPRLLIFSPSGRLLWNGGYAPRKPRATSPMADLPVMESVRRGEPGPEIPVFGCPRRQHLEN